MSRASHKDAAETWRVALTYFMLKVIHKCYQALIRSDMGASSGVRTVKIKEECSYQQYKSNLSDVRKINANSKMTGYETNNTTDPIPKKNYI